MVEVTNPSGGQVSEEKHPQNATAELNIVGSLKILPSKMLAEGKWSQGVKCFQGA